MRLGWWRLLARQRENCIGLCIASPRMPLCAACGKSDAKARCAACRETWFCSRECQRQGWAAHRAACRAAEAVIHGAPPSLAPRYLLEKQANIGVYRLTVLLPEAAPPLPPPVVAGPGAATGSVCGQPVPAAWALDLRVAPRSVAISYTLPARPPAPPTRYALSVSTDLDIDASKCAIGAFPDHLSARLPFEYPGRRRALGSREMQACRLPFPTPASCP